MLALLKPDIDDRSALLREYSGAENSRTTKLEIYKSEVFTCFELPEDEAEFRKSIKIHICEINVSIAFRLE